jgi:uncharacterized protein YjiS (DUF1127 family)
MLWIVSEWPPFRWLRSTLFWAARPRLLRLRIADAAALARSRRELAEMDDRLCDDIGVTRLEAKREAARQPLDELSPWAPLELRMAVAESRRRFAPHPWLRATGRARLR